MKKNLTFLLLLFVISNSYAQIDALIIFKDGTELRDVFKSRGNKLKSLESGKKYHINDMHKITYFKKDTITYDIIDTKIYLKSKRSSRQLLRIIYNGKNINLYASTESYQSGGTVGMTTYGNISKAFVQRKGEDFAYDISYIHAVQHKGIKKRLKAYFKDCPELIEKIKKKEIRKNEPMKIVIFYDEHCN